MPCGDKSAYTDKQKRQAEHIEQGELAQGRSHAAAQRIAWATVNKRDGGGKLSGSGRKPATKTTAATRAAAKRATSKTPAKTTKKAAGKVAPKKSQARKRS